MEAMCDWCGQVVPVGIDGTCFLGHRVSATPMPIGAPPPVDLDIAALPRAPEDTVAAVPEFSAAGPLPQPPLMPDMGPVPPALPPQPPVFTGDPTAPQPAVHAGAPSAPPPPVFAGTTAVPTPPHAPVVPPPVPAPPVPVPVAPTPLPQPVGAFAAAGVAGVAENPVDAAFAPLLAATAPTPASQQAPRRPPIALPPQAPTGPGWQAVHVADDVAVFEYRPPKGPAVADPVLAPLPPPDIARPGLASSGAGPLTVGAPLEDADVAAFAPGEELDLPESGSRMRQVILLCILAVVVLGAVLAFALGLV